MKLTGKTRHRTNIFGHLVLQVEYVRHHCRDLGGSGYYDEWQTAEWRDANVKDLPMIQPQA